MVVHPGRKPPPRDFRKQPSYRNTSPPQSNTRDTRLSRKFTKVSLPRYSRRFPVLHQLWRALTIQFLSLLALTATPAEAAPAPPSPLIALGSGSGIKIYTSPTIAQLCTLTLLAREPDAQLIGITAGHCGNIGDPVFEADHTDLGLIGRMIFINHYLDYGIIQLISDKVVPLHMIDGITVTKIGTFPQNRPQTACKIGYSSGVTCGQTWASTPSIQLSKMCVVSGDSGAPVVIGTTLVAMVNAYYVFGCIGPETGTTLAAIINDIGEPITLA